ncbi:MAG: glycosyltransferase [Geminicoccaceae bacterium]|nr:glycosyltransferase [Geminicoccaceae bacterium]MCB9942913.1 glycosyltransferase [Geminicoccaceae bacterium]
MKLSRTFDLKPVFAGRRLSIAVAAAYAILFAIVALNLPRVVDGAGTQGFIVTIGLLSIWRYGWWGVHVVRSTIFLNHTFPRLRKDADRVEQAARAPEIYVLITSYRVEAATSFKVYSGLVTALMRYGAPARIIASITDQSDVDMLQHVLDMHGHPGNIEIRFMFQQGDGKRSAMGEAARAIARDLPSPDSLVIFMDGDIFLPPDALERSLSFFVANPRLGAITTDNRGFVKGNGWTREWYDLRYAQRHLVMSSMALSRRLLVLTGRFSVFRGSIVGDRDFIRHVERDCIDHWRFGRFRFLSGDDKSTWFWLLRQGWEMLYVPDVVAYGFEELPDRHRFFASSIGLMRRWYGNMLRNNGRAIALGPRKMGLFTWWSLVDQRISMWTSLTGPIVAIMLTVAHSRPFLLGYLCWIMMTRVFASVLLGLQRHRFSPLWPVLLYYNQIVGALVKTWVTFRVNQQKWTRQNIVAGEPADPLKRFRQRLIGHGMHVTQFTGYVYALALMTGVLTIPDTAMFTLVSGRVEVAASDDYWLRAAIARAASRPQLQLPPGRFVLQSTEPIDLGVTVLRGAGADRTNLVLAGRLTCEHAEPCIEDAHVEYSEPAALARPVRNSGEISR